MLCVFRDRAAMGRTTLATHRCIALPMTGLTTGRLSRFWWMQALMLYCLMTLESFAFQIRKRCFFGRQATEVAEKGSSKSPSSSLR